MKSTRLAVNVTALIAAVGISTTPAFAAASAVQAPQISPMVALSIFGSQASVAALCGASAAATTASAAATAQAPAGGCVLPVVDAPPPPVPVAEVVPLSAPHGFGISPILLGLAGIAILAALIASQHHHNGNNAPVSVN